MKNSKEQKILRIIIDNKLNFKSHIKRDMYKGFSENCSFI